MSSSNEHITRAKTCDLCGKQVTQVYYIVVFDPHRRLLNVCRTCLKERARSIELIQK